MPKEEKISEEKPKQEEKKEVVKKNSEADAKKTPQNNEGLSTKEKSELSGEVDENPQKDSEVVKDGQKKRQICFKRRK